MKISNEILNERLVCEILKVVAEDWSKTTTSALHTRKYASTRK